MKYLFFVLSIAICLFSHHLHAKEKLSDFKYNVHSQFGEDGMIEKIFQTIGTKSKVCIEFGAWDGFLLSNTANLFSRDNWKAILIECDQGRFHELIKNVKNYKCKCLCEFVGIGSQSLENILRKHSLHIPKIDLLSIDIDGNDYYIFESLELMRPRVIICEYNPTLPAELDIFDRYHEGGYGLGCSVGALVRIARDKGYTLIGLTDTNAFFVRNDEVEKFDHIETSIKQIKIDDYINYMITDYQGQYSIVQATSSILPYGLKKYSRNQVLGNIRKIELPEMN